MHKWANPRDEKREIEKEQKHLAKVSANHANSSKNAFSVFSKSENVRMVETRAAITKESEKGTSIEYSQRSSCAPTRVFTSIPGSQSIPSAFFATHYETKKCRKKGANKSDCYLRHLRHNGRKTHT